MDLCLELHRKLKPYEAIGPYHPYFYEDPTTPDNFDSMAYIAEHIRIPVATGERYHTPQDFAMLARRNGAAFFRPDVCLCGGITGAKKIAACIPNFAIQEYPGDGWFRSRSVTDLQKLETDVESVFHEHLFVLLCVVAGSGQHIAGDGGVGA